MECVRVLITGCRHWQPYALAERLVPRMLARYGMGLIIVHGDAPGVDTTFREVAEECGVDTEAHPADWSLGRKAGPIRNQAMIAGGAVLCLAVHRDIGGSKGTRDCAGRAIAAGIPTYLVSSEDGEPARIYGV